MAENCLMLKKEAKNKKTVTSWTIQVEWSDGTVENLNDLPAVEDGDTVAADTIYSDYHEENFPFGGGWNPDSRICLQGAAPRPCTILAAIAEFESVEKSGRESR